MLVSRPTGGTGRPTERSLRQVCLATVLFAAALTLGGCGRGDSVRILAASSLQDVLPELLEAHAEMNGDATFEVQYGGSQALATQIELGAEADLFLSANALQFERLRADGRVGSAVAFASNRLVVAVAEASSIQTIADLGAPGLRIAVGAPEVPVGALTVAALAALDAETAEAIRANVVTEDPNARVVLSRLALDEVDAAFVYATDAASLDHVRAIEVEGVEPNVYVGGVVAGGSTDGDELLAFLAGHDAVPIWEAAGFEPLNVAAEAP